MKHACLDTVLRISPNQYPPYFHPWMNTLIHENNTLFQKSISKDKIWVSHPLWKQLPDYFSPISTTGRPPARDLDANSSKTSSLTTTIFSHRSGRKWFCLAQSRRTGYWPPEWCPARRRTEWAPAQFRRCREWASSTGCWCSGWRQGCSCRSWPSCTCPWRRRSSRWCGSRLESALRGTAGPVSGRSRFPGPQASWIRRSSCCRSRCGDGCRSHWRRSRWRSNGRLCTPGLPPTWSTGEVPWTRFGTTRLSTLQGRRPVTPVQDTSAAPDIIWLRNQESRNYQKSVIGNQKSEISKTRLYRTQFAKTISVSRADNVSEYKKP